MGIVITYSGKVSSTGLALMITLIGHVAKLVVVVVVASTFEDFVSINSHSTHPTHTFTRTSSRVAMCVLVFSTE